jgi:hypothetical protein
LEEFVNRGNKIINQNIGDKLDAMRAVERRH